MGKVTLPMSPVARPTPASPTAGAADPSDCYRPEAPLAPASLESPPETALQPARGDQPRPLLGSPAATLVMHEEPPPEPKSPRLELQLRVACLAPTPELATSALGLLEGEPRPGIELFQETLALDAKKDALVPLALELARHGTPPTDPLGNPDRAAGAAQASELSRRLPWDHAVEKSFWRLILGRFEQEPPRADVARALARDVSRLLYQQRYSSERPVGESFFEYVKESLPDSRPRLEQLGRMAEVVPRRRALCLSMALEYPETEPSINGLTCRVKALSDGGAQSGELRRLERFILGEMLAYRNETGFKEELGRQVARVGPKDLESWAFIKQTLADQPEGPALEMLDRWISGASQSDWQMPKMRETAASVFQKPCESPEQRLELLVGLQARDPAWGQPEVLGMALEDILPRRPDGDQSAELQWCREQANLPRPLLVALLERVRGQVGGDGAHWNKTFDNLRSSLTSPEWALDRAQEMVDAYHETRHEIERAVRVVQHGQGSTVEERPGAVLVGGTRVRRRS